ncbi:peptidase dimerization domain-containing protein [Pseudanabaenaceae cyanobacterium LEGE 13415]|nr:peptidase dimerization domain-containing protein [Pseudanabaenaceae cyanobacterium LEGE 13415]
MAASASRYRSGWRSLPEESGNFCGIREILHHAPKADVCILGYQSFDEIAIGARGWLRLKLTAYGEATHTGSRSRKGKNAVHALIHACSALLQLELAGQTAPFFEFGSAFNIAQIQGGEAINDVPDRAKALIDIRLLLTQIVQIIVQTIEQQLRDLQQAYPRFQYALEIRGLIRDQSDPGNRSTVKLVCESALSLALQSDELPGGQERGGILTSATGLGLFWWNGYVVLG